MFGYKKINIFFRPQGILDKKTFESVMNGKIVKYSDVLWENYWNNNTLIWISIFMLLYSLKYLLLILF